MRFFRIIERMIVMKKFMSLMLAVLMVLSVAVTVGAASTSEQSGIGNPVGIGDLLDYYKKFYSGSNLPSSSWCDDDDIYSTWYGSCPKCKGFAFFFVYDGAIRYVCLESDCGKTGTLDSKFNEDTSKKVYCPTCKKSSGVYHVDHVYDSETGKFVDTYFCVYCRETFKNSSSSVYPDKTPDDITCGRDTCTKKATFQYYAYADGVLYAYFKCSDGHYTKKIVSGYDYDDYFYSIKVITSKGGDYYVKGGEKAAYGEKKTITFEADRGYVLTDVYVNGEKVSFDDDEIKITVKSNTVVRAYFTKIASMKEYKITATSTNGGKITATLNGKSVTNPAKVTAKYNDKVVYRFTPASKNYTISSVKVNGKSVGTSSTYTVNGITSDTKIEVTFKWNCPYDDVKSTDKYYAAIEYVTEAGILRGSNTSNTLKPKYNFNGTRAVSVKTFACALAEMADVNDKLSNNTQRLNWAEKYGLVDEDEDVSVVCNVKRACAMVDEYLEVLEDLNDIEFDDFDRDDSAKENCIAIDMVTSSVYKKNRNLTKNDLAAVLYLIANLEYDD